MFHIKSSFKNLLTGWLMLILNNQPKTYNKPTVTPIPYVPRLYPLFWQHMDQRGNAEPYGV